ncbi:MAG: hypothetical protein ACR2FE_08885 [Aeromicrobium sp.]
MTIGASDLTVLDASPLSELSELVRVRDVARDLVDEQLATAVARARDAGVSWGRIAEALRGG